MKTINIRFCVRYLALGFCEANHESTKAREFKWEIAAMTGDNSIPQMRSTNIVAMELLLLALTHDCCSGFSARFEIDSLLFESLCNPLCLSALYCRSLSLSLSTYRHHRVIYSLTASLFYSGYPQTKMHTQATPTHVHSPEDYFYATLVSYTVETARYNSLTHTHTRAHIGTQRDSHSPSCNALAFLLWAIRFVRLFIFIQFENRFGAVRLCCTSISFYFLMLFPSDLIQL